jgi:DNA-binding transcriptional LysR family regulator
MNPCLREDRSFVEWIVRIIYIHNVNIRDIDLNLLVLFDALIVEGNLTRAAARVGLSQSAMSNALGRLRARLEDPLFVRAPGGVEPTDRARALAGPVREALAGLERALSPQVFEAATTQRRFTVMMNDIHELLLGPALSARVAGAAPLAELRFVQGPSTFPEQVLAAGDVDIVVSPLEGESPKCARSAIYSLSFATLVRRDHPRVGKRLSLERFLELEHVLVAPRGRPGGTIDDLLLERGLRRKVARMTAHFFSAVLLVCKSDYVVTLPSLLAESMARMLPLRVLDAPLDLPSVTMGQFWSTRSESDAGHRWLRQAITDTATELQRARRPRKR